ncbi:MAG TPA: flagella basal body P-ring formation protein FlgA [Allosphingosinicella sp.]|nr:flagella basal body P-ring formation protein FlgA [Allosphingosinicella sp.]
MTPIFRRLALLSAAAAAPALAQGFENLDALDSRIAGALGAAIGEPGGAANALDRRLRLAPCPSAATISEPMQGAVTVRCDAIGWRIRVAVIGGGAVAGPIAQAAPARAAPVVRRGDQVQIVALAGSFTVSSLGIAEQDGAPGERIRVRTERRSAPFYGQVLADGRVALPGFN